jgi:hypothetical protein
MHPYLLACSAIRRLLGPRGRFVRCLWPVAEVAGRLRLPPQGSSQHCGSSFAFRQAHILVRIQREIQIHLRWRPGWAVTPLALAAPGYRTRLACARSWAGRLSSWAGSPSAAGTAPWSTLRGGMWAAHAGPARRYRPEEPASVGWSPLIDDW